MQLVVRMKQYIQSIFKSMRISPFFLVILVTSCGPKVQDLDLDKDPLRGTLEGKEWEYKIGTGRYDQSTFAVSGLLVDFEVQEPCSIVVTSTNYVELSVPSNLGTYTLSVDPNTYVTLHLQNGVRYSVGAGFIQIVKFTGNALIGYLSADLDDNNKVKGSFLLTVCH